MEVLDTPADQATAGEIQDANQAPEAPVVRPEEPAVPANTAAEGEANSQEEANEAEAALGQEGDGDEESARRRTVRPLKRKAAQPAASTAAQPLSKRISTPARYQHRSVVFGVPSLTGGNAVPIARDSPDRTGQPRVRGDAPPALARRFGPAVFQSQSAASALGPDRPRFATHPPPSLSLSQRIPAPRDAPQFGRQPVHRPVHQPDRRAEANLEVPDLIDQLETTLTFFTDNTKRLIGAFQRFNEASGPAPSRPKETTQRQQSRQVPRVGVSESTRPQPSAGPSASTVQSQQTGQTRGRTRRGTRAGRKRRGRKDSDRERRETE